MPSCCSRRFLGGRQLACLHVTVYAVLGQSVTLFSVVLHLFCAPHGEYVAV